MLKPYRLVYEKLVLPIEIGDDISVGRFKNKTAIVTGFDKDDKNQPIILTDKGDTGLKFRIKKLIKKESISKNQILKLVKGMTPSQIVRFDFDKLAFGFSVDDVIQVPLKNLKIKYKMDMKNVIGYNMKDYFKGVSFSDLPPIDVIYEKGKFYISDGHHRYGYAKELKLKNINVRIEDIKDNPIITLGFNSIDDIINMS